MGACNMTRPIFYEQQLLRANITMQRRWSEALSTQVPTMSIFSNNKLIISSLGRNGQKTKVLPTGGRLFDNTSTRDPVRLKVKGQIGWSGLARVREQAILGDCKLSLSCVVIST